METSLNGMAEINEFDKHDIAGLKGLLHQVFHLKDNDMRSCSPWTLKALNPT